MVKVPRSRPTIMFEAATFTIEAHLIHQMCWLLNTSRPDGIDKGLAMVDNAMSGAHNKEH